ncbi:MAG: acyl-CoA thioesterase [Planctomycetota bacterium]|nr:MAG: acyl-CoA thioesterase [Planctomycetota bacterium]
MVRHTTEYRILFRDIDSMGVLYYGRYLHLFELGRTEWLREEGLRYRDMQDEEGCMLPVTIAECRYLAPLRYDSLARIETTLHGWSSATIGFRHEVRDGESGVLCATGMVEVGCCRIADWRPTRLPAPYRELLARIAPELRHRRIPRAVLESE